MRDFGALRELGGGSQDHNPFIFFITDQTLVQGLLSDLPWGVEVGQGLLSVFCRLSRFSHSIDGDRPLNGPF